MGLSIKTRARSRCLIVILQGDLESIADCREFRAAMLDALAHRTRVILVNCNELASLSSCGHDTILAASFMAHHRGGDFQLFGASEKIRDLFRAEDPKLLSTCHDELDAAKELVSMYDEEQGNPPFDILTFVREEEEGRVTASPEPA